jgi:hypothetical protein
MMAALKPGDADTLANLLVQIAERGKAVIAASKCPPTAIPVDQQEHNTANFPNRDHDIEGLLEATAKLQALVLEPNQLTTGVAWAYFDSAALCLVMDMKIPSLIPPGDRGSTLEQLASSTGASSQLISKRDPFSDVVDFHWTFNNNCDGKRARDETLRQSVNLQGTGTWMLPT